MARVRSKRRRAKVDLISMLPDELLCGIISMLPMREAARTSVLSSRWRRLWTQTPCLKLSSRKLFEVNQEESLKPFGVEMKNIFSFADLESDFRDAILKKLSRKFIRSVNKIIKHRCGGGEGLEKFAIHYYLHRRHARTLNPWIASVLSTRIKELEILLDKDRLACFLDEEPCEFPFHLFSEGRGASITNLALQFFAFKPPLDFGGLKSLKKLELTYVFLDNIDMETILCSCPTLDHLFLAKAMGLSILKINLSCPRLNHLELFNCYDLMKVEISSLSLASFEYIGSGVISFDIIDAPNLKKSFFLWQEDLYLPEDDHSYGKKVTELPSLPRVEFLTLRIPAIVDGGFLRCKRCSCLKHLRLSLLPSAHGDVLWVASLLAAAPVLSKLELQLICLDSNPRQLREIRRPSKCPHAHLQTVHINGFVGTMSQIEFALYILNNALALKLMIVDPMYVDDLGEDVEPTIANQYSKHLKAARKMARKYLCQEVPSGASLCYYW